MDQGLKERLVGAAVLVAIGVWLIPWVLDGPDAPLETGASTLQLPAAEEPMPMRTQTLRLGDPVDAASTQAAEAPPEPAAAPPAAPAVTPPAPEADEQPAAVAAEQRTEPAAETAAAVREAPPPSAPTEAKSEVKETAAPPPAAVAAAPAPKPAQSAPPGDWLVQLGSFGEEANARRLAQRAGTFGYKAEVASYRSEGRTLYRVRVGPATTRAKADATASALRAHGIESRVVAAR
jgi:DedD protein